MAVKKRRRLVASFIKEMLGPSAKGCLHLDNFA